MSRILQEVIGPRTVRLITLTIRTTDESLETALDHLSKSFVRLRHSPLWASTQKGGAAFIEVTWNPHLARWHPHLHILSQGNYIPKAKLLDAWRKASRGSLIIDIRLVSNPQTLTRYVTKYVTKPVTQNVTKDRARFEEAVRAFRGRRLCTTFGAWRGTSLTTREKSDDWDYVGSYADLRDQALTCSDSQAAHVMQCLNRLQPLAIDDESARAPPVPDTNQPYYDHSDPTAP